MKSPMTIRPGRSFQLEDLPTTDVAGFKDKADGRGQLEKHLERLRELQHLLYADGRYAVLIVLQAMDTGG